MREVMKSVSHQQASQLLHNKFVVVLGDSIQRSVYKDLVLHLQKEKYLTLRQLKSKGEMSFEEDHLVEGGCLEELHNGTEYREVRQFRTSHHLVRFYFVTRIFSRYMESILEDFRQGLKPDVLIVNSCVWDISRYSFKWVEDYKENLNRFFDELQWILPEETLVIWNLTMPLGERIRGGFLVPEIKHKASSLRYDVVEANFYSGTLADSYGFDVLDLHFQFRLCLHHRTNDGVHWNAIAHRRITFILLQHIAQAWGVILSCPLTTIDYSDVTNQASSTSTTKEERQRTNVHYNSCREPSRHCMLSSYYSGHDDRLVRDYHAHGQYGFEHPPTRHHKPYRDHRHQDVLRSRHSRRHHYAPYTHHRPVQHGRHAHY